MCWKTKRQALHVLADVLVLNGIITGSCRSEKLRRDFFLPFLEQFGMILKNKPGENRAIEGGVVPDEKHMEYIYSKHRLRIVLHAADR